MIFKPEDFYIHGSEEPMGPNVASQLANEAYKKKNCSHRPHNALNEFAAMPGIHYVCIDCGEKIKANISWELVK